MTDQLFAGLFVLFLAVIFAYVWFKLRTTSKNTRRPRMSHSGRLAQSDNFAQGQHRAPPARVRKDVAEDGHRSHEIWKSRRKRSNEKRRSKMDTESGMVYASYVSEDSASSYGEARNQEIGDREYASIGEYLAKQDLEAEAVEGDDSGLSMTAMKYEPQDSAEEAAKQKKSGTKD